MPDWSIKIVPSSSGSGAAFQPDLQGYGPGAPLPAQQDDLVTWANTTGQTHKPSLTDSNYNPITPDPVRGTKNYRWVTSEKTQRAPSSEMTGFSIS